MVSHWMGNNTKSIKKQPEEGPTFQFSQPQDPHDSEPEQQEDTSQDETGHTETDGSDLWIF